MHCVINSDNIIIALFFWSQMLKILCIVVVTPTVEKTTK